SLQFFGDCPALVEHMRQVAGDRVTAWGLDGGFHRGPFPVDEFATDDTTAAADFDMAAEESGRTEAAGPAYSETNVQEAGVDEGDVVETDGEFVYVADHSGVRIVRVADAEVVATLDAPEGGHELLLDGSRLAVITSQWNASADTVVSVYDVGDPTNPALTNRDHLEGSLLASRAIDGTVRLVLSTSFGQRLPFVTPGQFGYDEERALERNREIIATSSADEWLPRRFVEDPNGAFGPMEPALDCQLVGAPDTFSGLGVTWIATFDIDAADAPVGSAGVVSSGSIVYASPDSIYVANQYWVPGPVILADAPSAQVEAPTGPPPTVIHQFDLLADEGDGLGATYVASGTVEGGLLNQFSMSEHNGDLRVATTVEDWSPNGSGSESFVTVLRPTDGELTAISSIGGLGRGEQIYAVRFMGDVGYVVTFRQIDPLYVLDLTDPANPVLEGELKIPGYSAYLHPVGDGLLLGVGQDASEEGIPLG
ncbi:MAG: beta-propeller domain-containing protein, partial [Cytophagales bacterium]|nr:beta-propeller domain-containing protein [Cytophagales bacterium]